MPTDATRARKRIKPRVRLVDEAAPSKAAAPAPKSARPSAQARPSGSSARRRAAEPAAEEPAPKSAARPRAQARARRPQRDSWWGSLRRRDPGDVAGVLILLACVAASVPLHERARQDAAQPVAGLATLDPAQRDRLIYRELRLARQTGQSIQSAARRIGQRYGRPADEVAKLLWKGDTENWPH